jgi:hypothetical protein
LLRRVVWCKFTDFLDVLAASIIKVVIITCAYLHGVTTQKTAISANLLLGKLRKNVRVALRRILL